MSESAQDKTEDPTAQKLKKARDDGQVARSMELPAAVIVIGSIAMLMVTGSWVITRLSAVFAQGFVFDRQLIEKPLLLPAHFGEHLLADRTPPDWHQLDNLADAITSIEYYLERLNEDPQNLGEQVLDVAEQSLGALGYLPREVPVTASSVLWRGAPRRSSIHPRATKGHSQPIHCARPWKRMKRPCSQTFKDWSK